MQTRNDATLAGPAFAAAVRSILPRGTKRDPGYIILRPMADGAIMLEGFYVSAPVPAEGAWTEAVNVPGRFLRGFVTGKPPASVRLIFFDKLLSINGTTVSAHALADGVLPWGPLNQPTNRLGAPLATVRKPRSLR